MKLQFMKMENREGDVREFIFQPPQDFTWQAGQYMHYILSHENTDDRGDERWFTISSAPSEGEVRITTRINSERSSSFKKALQELRLGQEVQADGPDGDFVLNDTDRNYIFVVGGIGITPVRSMLVDAQDRGLQINAAVLYANRNQDIPFRDELDQLQAQNPNLKVQYIVEPDRLDEARLRDALTAADDPLVYISGPEPMVKSLAELAKNLGVDGDNLKIDDFPGYENI